MNQLLPLAGLKTMVNFSSSRLNQEKPSAQTVLFGMGAVDDFVRDKKAHEKAKQARKEAAEKKSAKIKAEAQAVKDRPKAIKLLNSVIVETKVGKKTYQLLGWDILNALLTAEPSGFLNKSSFNTVREQFDNEKDKAAVEVFAWELQGYGLIKEYKSGKEYSRNIDDFPDVDIYRYRLHAMGDKNLDQRQKKFV